MNRFAQIQGLIEQAVTEGWDAERFHRTAAGAGISPEEILAFIQAVRSPGVPPEPVHAQIPPALQRLLAQNQSEGWDAERLKQEAATAGFDVIP